MHRDEANPKTGKVLGADDALDRPPTEEPPASGRERHSGHNPRCLRPSPRRNSPPKQAKRGRAVRAFHSIRAPPLCLGKPPTLEPSMRKVAVAWRHLGKMIYPHLNTAVVWRADAAADASSRLAAAARRGLGAFPLERWRGRAGPAGFLLSPAKGRPAAYRDGCRRAGSPGYVIPDVRGGNAGV